MKTLLTVAVIVLVAVGLIFGWFYLYGPCGTKVVELSVSELQGADSQFSDEFQAASSLSRLSLSGPINDLQKLEWTTDQIVVPACLGRAKNIYVKGMQEGIDGLVAFSRKNASSLVNEHINSSRSLLDYASTELFTVSECAPFCKTNRGTAIAYQGSGCPMGSVDCENITSTSADPFPRKHILTSPLLRVHPSSYRKVR